MITLFLIGRVVFALYWLRSAYGHIFNSSALTGYTQSKAGYSAGTAKFAVIGTGILLAVGGLTILTGDWPRVGIACLIIFLLGAAFKMHAYWKVSDPMARMGDHVNFWKDIALAAALLMLLAIPTPWLWTL